MERSLVVRLALFIFMTTVHCVYMKEIDKQERQALQISGLDFMPFSSSKSSRLLRETDTSSTGARVDWNSVVDHLIDIAKSEIKHQENDVTRLPDVDKEFKKKKGIFRLKARFIATEGWLKSLSSLKRTGDVSVEREGSSLKMTTLLGFGDLTLGYDRLTVEVWKTRSTGSVKGKVGKNSVRVTLKFDMKDGGCVTTLEDVKLLDFSDFHIDVKGLGGMDWLTSQVIDWVTKKRDGDIEAGIERTLTTKITKALKDFHCDEYANLLMLPL